MTRTRACSFPVPMSASRALPDRSRTRCPAEIIGWRASRSSAKRIRRKVNVEGPREVLVGESPDGVRWVVRERSHRDVDARPNASK